MIRKDVGDEQDHGQPAQGPNRGGAEHPSFHASGHHASSETATGTSERPPSLLEAASPTPAPVATSRSQALRGVPPRARIAATAAANAASVKKTSQLSAVKKWACWMAVTVNA